LPAVIPKAPASTPVAFDADDPISLYMNSGIFEQLQRVAKMMAKANLVPAHLRGDEKIADCFLVAAQAFRWRMDPFSVAQHTFVTQGKLGYEGKLIAGLINASGRLQANLKPIYSGARGTPDRAVRIVGRIKGEAEDREIEGTVKDWKTNNEKWSTMPDQMLVYRGAREWARRHMPEVMLGIQADEEVAETVALQPQADGSFAAPRTLEALTEKLQAAETAACAHPRVTADILASVPVGQKWACSDCGASLDGTKQADGPKADEKKGRQSRLGE
jgi:hypothetical protein